MTRNTTVMSAFENLFSRTLSQSVPAAPLYAASGVESVREVLRL